MQLCINVIVSSLVSCKTVQFSLVLTAFSQVCFVYMITSLKSTCVPVLLRALVREFVTYLQFQFAVCYGYSLHSLCPSQLFQQAISNLDFGIHSNHYWAYINKCFSYRCTLQKLEMVWVLGFFALYQRKNSFIL